MKFARLGDVGSEIPVVMDGDRYLDLRSITSDIDGAFLASGQREVVVAALANSALPVLEGASDMRVGAPIARPSAVVCIGMNYAAHAAESGSAPPTIPIMFLKTPNTVVGPNDTVEIPKNSVKTDWEVEL
ncbi:MAG: fumarylacetoacetate hydrolase family protein, partial [Rhodoglobus sp.]